MEYIEINSVLIKHPQLFELAELLGVPLPEALGVLVKLWLWGLGLAPDGDLSCFSAEDIASAVKWDGEAEELVSALKTSGFLDKRGIICKRDKHNMELVRWPRKRGRACGMD